MKIATTRSRRGFTLVEVLVAVTVFSLVLLAAYAVFRGAIRSNQVALRETETIQRARYVMDSLERDFANIFFRDETSYNIAIARLIEQMEMARFQAEESGDWDTFYAQFGRPEGDRGSREEEPTIGNPYDKGRMIDLQFVGQDAGELDTVSFTVREPLEVGRAYRPYGLTRIQYAVANGVLIRSGDTIETETRTVHGDAVAKPEPPSHAILGEGVEKFNLTYAFWYDNQWYEAAGWNSANRQIRNPRYIVGEHEWDREGSQDEFTLLPGDQGWNEYLNDLQSEPLDRLPAYVRLELTLLSKEGEGRRASYERVFRLAPSIETYAPTKELTEDQREEERESRDDSYNLVLPGAMGAVK